MNICIVLFFTFAAATQEFDDLDGKLHQYEILETVSVHSVTRRSLYSLPADKNVRFTALGKNFSLHLSVAVDILSEDFKLIVIDGQGKARQDRSLDTRNFYRGTVEGEVTSDVLAYFENGALTATISTKHDDYMVEPLWRHTNTKSKSTMVVYKGRDVKDSHTNTTGSRWPVFIGGGKLEYREKNHRPAAKNRLPSSLSHAKYCGAVQLGEHGEIVSPDTPAETQTDTEKHRSKRASISQTRCQMLGVADYRFFSTIGNRNIYTTANYMIMVLAKASAIFENTGFVYGTGLGLQLVELRIHQEYSSGSDFPYNTDAKTWTANSFLTKFSQGASFSSYCLAHLFTHQNMGTVHGMAYIATSSASSAGGICSQVYSSGGVTFSANTGWTTSMDQFGNTVLARISELVTTHEIGHNWGSQHDPSSCIPSSITSDGKYLMYQYSVTGDEANNFLFSSCSINSINRVLQAKARDCFKEYVAPTLCGNAVIDAGEECDGGLIGRLNQDQCCSPGCTLRTGKVCTPVNFPCCTSECQIAGTGLLCAGGVEGSCKKDTHCDGVNTACPVAQNKDNGTACLDSGSCLAGECKSYCGYRGWTSCVCSNAEDSCKQCCKKSNNLCVVANQTALHAEGRPCVYGYCDAKGVCIKTEGNTISKLWDLIEQISIDLVVEAFRTNMVAFIQVFSLILFVPLSCCVWCRAKYNRRERESSEKIKIRTHRKLIYDQDGNKIQVKKPKARPGHRNIHPNAPLPPIQHGPVVNRRPMSGRPPSVMSTSSRRRNQVAPTQLPRRVDRS